MDAPKPFVLADAFASLKDAVCWIINLWGAPEAIAAQKFLRRETRQHILQWLAPIEALARRVLLIAALEAPPANAAPTAAFLPPVRSALRDTPPAPDLSDDPTEWRTIFKVWPYARRVSAPARCEGVGLERTRGCDAYPLAKRLEALIRLARDPASCIARLARRLALARRQAPRAFAPYRHRGGPVQTLLREAQAAVDAALANTS
jgi:hypothetical protein